MLYLNNTLRQRKEDMTIPLDTQQTQRKNKPSKVSHVICLKSATVKRVVTSQSQSATAKLEVKQ